MIIILLVVALFFLAEMLFPARAENGGELMFPEPPDAPHRVVLEDESDLEMARRLR